MIDPKVEAQLRTKREELQKSDELISDDLAREHRARFMERFGPTVLAALDGDALLRRMHDNLSRDSMVYWLEYKNDEDFHERWFGGIGGRSALKFRFFHRREDSRWITGTNADQREITEAEAIDLARRHRDQILAIVKLLESFPEGASDEVSLKLQKDIEKAATDLGRAAFVHKYMALAFPTKLDDYHSVEWQAFHLKKLLLAPPGDGLYAPAGRFAAVAQHMGWPIQQLTQACNALNGRPHRYWRVGTSDGTEARNRWALMRDGHQVAIGWPALGDLTGAKVDTATKEKIRSLMAEKYPNDPRQVGKATQEVLYFAAAAQPGDLVIACEGSTVLGVARITDGYRYSKDGGSDFPHRIPVKWLDLGEWPIPNPATLIRTSFVAADKDPTNVIAIERRILGSEAVPEPLKKNAPSQPPELPPWVARIAAVLERKKQVILYGPPGTGKTHWAELAARELGARKAYGKAWAELEDAQRTEVFDERGRTPSLVRMCCFHPSYGYEDFLEGYRPRSENGQLRFELQDGIFKRLCDDAAKRPDADFFLLIDEINRGDLPRIFGELLMIIEAPKRGRPVLLSVSGQAFVVPRNVYIIGTMNTADRSIALLDKALRRRFGFIEFLPEKGPLAAASIGALPLWPWLEALNKRLCQYLGRDARNLQIGHAYFLDGGEAVSDARRLRRILREDVLPLLEDYCYDDWPTLAKIIGAQIVDTPAQRFREDLFYEGREDDLITALLDADLAIASSGKVLDDLAADEDEEPEGPSGAKA